MSASQRNKGATGEREVGAKFEDQLGVPVKRRLDQTRDGGYDLEVFGIAIEVKRTQQVGLDAALRQVGKAKRDDQLGAVVHRANGCPWKVTLTFEDFCQLVREAQ